MNEARTLSVSILRPAREVYDYLATAEYFPRWSFFITDMKRAAEAETWIASTPGGGVSIRFAPRNDFGIVDHHVTTGTGETVFVPLRVVPNTPDGSEVLFTIFRSPTMDDRQFEEDMAMVSKDLASLKRVLEAAVSS